MSEKKLGQFTGLKYVRISEENMKISEKSENFWETSLDYYDISPVFFLRTPAFLILVILKEIIPRLKHLLKKTAFSNITSSQSLNTSQLLLQTPCFDDLQAHEKEHASCFTTYQSNVFYLHTGLDKFEFGECTYAYRKPLNSNAPSL